MEQIVSTIIGGIEVKEEDSANAFSQGIGLVGRCDDVRNKNYPNNHIVDYIKNLISKNDYEVWDIGGSSGIYYFATGAEKTNSTWRVFEKPDTWERYKWIISGSHGGNNLQFEQYRNGDEIQIMSPKPVIILCVGSFQYLEKPLDFISKHKHKADTIILKDLNLANTTFLACQKGVGTCWFHDLNDVTSRLNDFRWRVIQEGKEYIKFTGPRELTLYPQQTIIAEK